MWVEHCISIAGRAMMVCYGNGILLMGRLPLVTASPLLAASSPVLLVALPL